MSRVPLVLVVVALAGLGCATSTSSTRVLPALSAASLSVAGGAAGYGVAKVVQDLGSFRSLLLGLSVGLLAAAATSVSAAARSSRRAVLSAAVMLPLAFAAPVTYVLGRMVVG